VVILPQSPSDARSTFSLTYLEGKAMKKMIQTMVTFAVMFFAVSTVAHAQGRGGGRPSMAAILRDSLHVSDAVGAKADSIVKVYQQKNTDLRASANGDMASVAPKMQELRTQQINDLKALLTADQKTAFDKIVAAMPQGRRGGGR
jgi:protein CpxP